jgi:DNA-binding MarR family transcriptional regulator
MDSVSRQRVGLVSARYLDNPEVGALELAVLFVLCTHANRLGVCWPSQATIAVRTKLDRGTVNRVLAKLVALGLIEKGHHPNPRIRTCTYRLVGHDALIEDFLVGLDSSAEEVSVGVGDTEHSEQDSLSLKRAGAHQGGKDFVDQGRAADEAAVLDESWAPDPADLVFAGTHRPDLVQSDLSLIAQKFVLHYRGKHVADPSGLFRRWLLTEKKNHVRIDFPDTRRPSSRHDHVRRTEKATPPCSGQARFDAWARAALARRERFAYVG